MMAFVNPFPSCTLTCICLGPRLSNYISVYFETLPVPTNYLSPRPGSRSAMIHRSKRDTSPITLRLSLAPLTLPCWSQTGQWESLVWKMGCLGTLICPKWINLVNLSGYTCILISQGAIYKSSVCREPLHHRCVTGN